MTTLELVKSRIESVNKNTNTTKEIDAVSPIIKRQRVNDKMCYILQNPETLKFAVITDDQMNELNDLFHIAKYGVSVNDDPFMFKA